MNGSTSSLSGRRLLLRMPALLWAAPRSVGAEASPEGVTTERLMAMLASVPERRASFREEKTFAALAQPLVSFGRLSYRRPAHLEKITTTPAPERLVVDGSRLVLTEGQEPPRAIDLDGVPELRALVDAVRATLSGDLALLQQSFTLATAGQTESWRITLSPRDARIARLVSRVLVEGAGAEPLHITTVQPNGDADRLDITPDH